MKQGYDPERLTVVWAPEARGDLRAIERNAAMQILYGSHNNA